MTIKMTRRGIIGGFVGLVAAPAVVKASWIMPVKTPKVIVPAKIYRFWIEGFNASGFRDVEYVNMSNERGGTTVLGGAKRLVSFTINGEKHVVAPGELMEIDIYRSVFSGA